MVHFLGVTLLSWSPGSSGFSFATKAREHQRVIPIAIGMMPELREKDRPQKNGVKKFTEWSVKPKTLGGFYNS